eukprot:s594_g2.t5
MKAISVKKNHSRSRESRDGPGFSPSPSMALANMKSKMKKPSARGQTKRPAKSEKRGQTKRAAKSEKRGSTAKTGKTGSKPKAPVLKRPSQRGSPRPTTVKYWSFEGIVAALIVAAAIDFSKPFRKVLYIMRGPPGSGKSSVARLLLQKHLVAQGLRWNPSQPGAAFSPICRAFICSTDDYFTKLDEEGDAIYDFEPQRLRELHQKNQQRCRDAMELSRTPLFVDNTNMALWEMSEYVMLAEEFNYEVMIIGAEQLGAGALDLRVLQMRCAQEAGRADGKEIPSTTLERMISRYEPLPEEVQGVRFWNAAELDLLKSAKPKPRFRYAGLDVETSALEALAAIDLGPLFWEGAEQPEGQRHFLAARGMADRWTSPDRLHVTVLYFGKDSKRQEAEGLVGRTFAVKVSGLVFIRCGSLLCATCEFSSDDYATLASLSEDWRPHITPLDDSFGSQLFQVFFLSPPKIPIPKMADGDGEKAPWREEKNWTGVSSVWEFQVSWRRVDLQILQGGDIVSREVPVYLEDALLGLRGGPGDSKTREGGGSPSHRLISDSEKRVQLLKKFLVSESCVLTGSSLFWLVLSAIFHCVPAQVVEVSRVLTGKSWHSFQLEVSESLKHDLPTRQWIMSTMPFVFAQVIFRMYFDGFPEDRNMVLSHSNNFINNIMLVIHFEMVGFAINLDTARKLRQTLFLRRVLDSPHANQADYLAGQRRQAELEQQNSHTRPLKFGKLDAPCPDEIQLEHVLQAREGERSGKNNWMTATASLAAKKDLIPADLSVDRYLPLSTQGMAMLDRHFSEMARISGDDCAEADPEAVAELDMDLIDTAPGWDRNSSNLNFDFEDDLEDPVPLSPTSPTATMRSGDEDAMSMSFSEGKKAVRMRRARMAGHLSAMQKRANEKREEEAKMKRQRQQLLEQKLKTEALPDRFCTTELNTTWVSPGMLSLHSGAEDRDVMRMSRTSAFALKMAPKNPHLVGPISLRHRRGVSKEDQGTPGQGDPLERGSPNPRSPLARGGETLTLEPPWNLSNKVVYNRVEVATKASQSHSFAMYTKEYDVFTGDLKQRFDEARLRNEEDDAYLKKMRSMVGGSKMKKLLYPGGDLGRRSKSSPGLHGLRSF